MPTVSLIADIKEVEVYDGELFCAVVKAAGCRGHVIIDMETGRVELRDGSDLVLWSASLIEYLDGSPHHG